MAFDNKKFAPIGGNASKAMAMYGYRTSDTLTEITTAGYFTELKFTLDPGDTISVTNDTENALLVVSSDRISAVNYYVPINDGLDTWVLAGYGGINLSTPAVIGTISNAAWTALPFDSSKFTPRFAAYNLPSSAISVDREGIWQISVSATLTFTGENFGRTMTYRLYNLTDGLPGDSTFAVFVGRNTDGATASITTLADIPVNWIGKDIVFQASTNGDTFNNVTMISGHIDFGHMSEAKALEV